MANQTRQRLDDQEIGKILNDFDVNRVAELFDSKNLMHIREFLVDIFQGPRWTHPRHQDERNALLRSIARVEATSDDHRLFFHALAESGNAHGVIGYLHMLDAYHKVKLSDRTALLSTSDLHAMVESAGLGIATTIHHLARAMMPDNPRSVRALWALMQKLHDPDHDHSARWLGAMQTIVNRFGLQATGLGLTNIDNEPWINLFFNAKDKRSVQIAGSVLASQMTRHLLTKETLIDRARGLGDEMRLMKSFDIKPQAFQYQSMHSSHPHRVPDYRF